MRLTNANAQTNTLWSDLAIIVTITLTLSLSSLPTTWALSDKRLCADEKCEKIISMGSAKITYMAGEEGMLPFKIHSPVRILSKSAGNNPQLWGVEINGRRGYANKDFIMEKQVLIKETDLKHEMPVELARSAKPPTANNPVAPQPVLNASETADESTTTATTTSPLDTLKLAILTEQDATGSSEASTPITPVQPNHLQMVDGTELPLEVVERNQNLTQANETNENAELANETNGVNVFNDYEDDDEENSDEDDIDSGTEATLDSKDNAITNDTKADSKAEDVQVEKTLEADAIKTEEAKPTLAAATAAAGANSSNEADAKLAASTDTPIETNTATNIESPSVAQLPVVEASANEPTLLVETRNVIAEPEATEPQLKVAAITEPAQPKVDDLKVKEATPAAAIETVVDSLPVEPTKAEVVSAESANQNASEEIAATAPNTTVEAQVAAQLVNATDDGAKLEDASSKPATTAAEVTSKDQVEAEQTKPTEAQPSQVETATTIAAEATEKPAEITANVTKVETPDVVDAAPKAEEIVASTVATPINEPITAATLPPLFKHQHLDNPNEYYKQLQEQQQQLQQQQEQQKLVQQQPQEQQQQQKLQDEQKQQEQREQQQQQQQEQQLEQEKLQEQQQQEQQKLQEQQQLEKQKQEEEQQKLLEQQQLEQQKLHEQQLLAQRQREQEQLEQRRQEQLKQQQQHKEQQLKLKQEQQEELQRRLLEQQQQQQQQKELQQQQEQQQQQQELLKDHTTPTPFDPYNADYEAEPTPAPQTDQNVGAGSVEPLGQPLPAEPLKEDVGEVGPGLFGTIMNTVNSFISNQGRNEPKTEPLKGHDELHRLLYPQGVQPQGNAQEEGYCSRPLEGNCHASITLDNFVEVLAAKLVEHSLLLLCVFIAAVSSLFFMLTYYCFCNSSQEGALLAKLNHLERSLLASHKENLLIKHDLMTTRTKLASIEDNSFGSNDMVAALKKQLETELYEKAKLQEQIGSLEKDLDNAAEAGLELNKMLSEVLNSQNGDEAFMSTVDELQRQLNDQEKIIIDINASLAEKSRENSELQYSYTESTTRLTGDMKSLQQDNYELEMEKSKLQTRLEEIQAESEQELAKALEARNYEMQRLQNQIMKLNAKYDKEHSELQTSLAKIEALEECLKAVKKDSNTNMQDLITSAKTRGELNAAQKKYTTLQTKLDQELAAKARLESQLQASSTDVEQLKQDFNQSERDKLEAQTRLEVLSGYFREKETQLQKELSLQEAKWLQHQGENASTVETQTLMKNEIQTLKSQNDELRAEIEAQIASHKAQMGTLENRAHESWLAARQSERRCEEAQAEAAGLRRKLTTMATGAGDMALDSLPANGGLVAGELTGAPSPLPLPGSPGLLNLPNPLPFLPAPFSPFMGLPPPFLPPSAAAGGARPPPLGRMRSPPPRSSSRDRYSPRRDDRDDYSDYDDYDDDDDDERGMDRHRRHSGSWGRGHRDSYVHSPRTYRSLSPSDSRYNYNDTETDFSPPPSPPPPRKSSSRPINEV